MKLKERKRKQGKEEKINKEIRHKASDLANSIFKNYKHIRELSIITTDINGRVTGFSYIKSRTLK